MKSTLKRLDAVHERLANTVNAVDPALLYKRPAENEWSVAEVIEHLCLVEEAVMKGIKVKLAQPPVKVSFLKKFFPMRIVSLRVKRLQAPKYVQPATTCHRLLSCSRNLTRSAPAQKKFASRKVRNGFARFVSSIPTLATWMEPPRFPWLLSTNNVT